MENDYISIRANPISFIRFIKSPMFLEKHVMQRAIRSNFQDFNRNNRVSRNTFKQKIRWKAPNAKRPRFIISGKLDLNLRDCGLLIKIGVLGKVTMASDVEGTSHRSIDNNIRELLARLQIGHLEAKHKALDTLVDDPSKNSSTSIELTPNFHMLYEVNVFEAWDFVENEMASYKTKIDNVDKEMVCTF
ncbi:hypothetical protein L2E82_42614 [Cichorium intybus]|uniref:Uncharacterized protein n=1 Tax=Cichorium intybus TaxID=13427 RepID=A0ACB8ZMC1_CICIN|nr:hypothetical protein L2E82_42614 [Cichorium intybus]